jgi:tRNA threonylcarbamoyladenosine biosynthesis protein TsaB
VIVLIESSAEFPSVAVCDLQGGLVWNEVGADRQAHAEQLPMMVQRAVDEVRRLNDQILAVGFQEGPGSYTGLRIGVSLAKGLCYGLGVPLISISGFEALARFALDQRVDSKEVWVMMDARRDEVYALHCSRDKGVVGGVTAEILPSERVKDYGDATVFVGNANEKVERLLAATDSIFLDESPRAAMMCGMACEAFSKSNFVDLAYYEPYYLKDFVAGIGKKFSI